MLRHRRPQCGEPRHLRSDTSGSATFGLTYGTSSLDTFYWVSNWYTTSSGSGTSPLVPYPWGAHYVPAPLRENRLLVTLLEEMEILEGRDRDGEPVVAEQFLCRDPQERLFYRGRWYEGLYLHAGVTPEDLAP